MDRKIPSKEEVKNFLLSNYKPRETPKNTIYMPNDLKNKVIEKLYNSQTVQDLLLEAKKKYINKEDIIKYIFDNLPSNFKKDELKQLLHLKI